MTHRPTSHRASNRDKLRRAIATFLAELDALPPEPALVPIPVEKTRSRPRR